MKAVWWFYFLGEGAAVQSNDMQADSRVVLAHLQAQNGP